jgi:hypothetical protein
MRALIAIIRLHTRSSPARDDNTRRHSQKGLTQSVGRTDSLSYMSRTAHIIHTNTSSRISFRGRLSYSMGERKKWVSRKSRCSSNWKRVSRCWVRARGTCAERCACDASLSRLMKSGAQQPLGRN